MVVLAGQPSNDTSSAAGREGPHGSISLESLGYNVFSTLEAPLGWSACSLPRRAELPRDIDAYWEAKTGVAPADSNFTLIVPIHNEGRGMRTYFGALMSSVFPASVNAQVVFVTNGCTDDSPQIVRDSVTRIGRNFERRHDPSRISSQQMLFGDELFDSGVTQAPLVVNVGAAQYVHVNTDTRGKANALNIGNELALRAGNRVVMSMDADCCPEPEAIMTMFAEMHKAIAESGDRPPLLSGMNSTEWNWNRELPPAERARSARVNVHRDLNKNSKGVMGWFMAWDARWLERVGGVPHAVIEDFALGIKAEVEGGGRRVVDAKIWGFGPTDRADHWDAIIRYAQGMFQMRDLYAENPDASRLIKEESAWLISPTRLLSIHGRALLGARSFTDAARAAYHAARHAHAFVQGWYNNRRDPESMSWRQLKSTRL